MQPIGAGGEERVRYNVYRVGILCHRRDVYNSDVVPFALEQVPNDIDCPRDKPKFRRVVEHERQPMLPGRVGIVLEIVPCDRGLDRVTDFDPPTVVGYCCCPVALETAVADVEVVRPV